MSQESQVQTSLRIKKGNLLYQSQPNAFNADVAGTNGPSPGAVTIATKPTSISFAQLNTMGGLCRIMNIDTTNFVTWGILDSVTHHFYPLGEMLPGETYVLRLSRKLGTEYGTGAGTGTDVVGTGDTLAFKADNAQVVVLVEAFDK